MIGREIGNYRITQRLGRGGVGEVFAGMDLMLNRPVAIKALRAEFGRDPAVVARFRLEAESLARLNHPNITTLYSLQRDGDELFMIMELVRGQTLEALLADRRRLSEREALAVTAQALDGLGYAHEAGVIHRDIKTGNLMVGPAGLLKIMDFGIARVRGSGRLTRQGQVVGTLAYMSPEQVRGEEGDERSDLYSLAIVLYEALSGDPPFVSDSEYALIRAQVEADPPRLIGRVSNVRPKVEEALMRALAKRPADRFATAAEFGRALGVSGLNGKAVDVVRHSLGSVVSKATHIEMAAPADSHHHPPGHVSKRPAEKGTRLVHAPEPGSVEKARSPASGPRRWSRRLPAAVLAAAIAMVAGVVVYAVLDLTRESPGVTQNPPTWEGSASQEGENRAAVRAQGEDAGIGSSGSPSVPGSHDETGATDMTSKPPIAPHPQEGVKQSSVLPSDEPQPTPENVVGRKAGEPPARNVHEPRRPHKVKKTPQPESPWIIRRE